jgi:hypothetical protein
VAITSGKQVVDFRIFSFWECNLVCLDVIDNSDTNTKGLYLSRIDIPLQEAKDLVEQLNKAIHKCDLMGKFVEEYYANNPNNDDNDDPIPF